MKEKQFLMIDENQSILVVDAEVLRKLDDKRGGMGRSEYLNFLIEGMLKSNAVTGDFVPKAEFHEFAQGMKDLLRNFLEFFLSYGLELGKQPEDRTFAELSQKLETLGSGSAGKSRNSTPAPR
ncbi:MAG: hypothetical protein Q8O05_06025 [Chloroflexota bacterium]|nr:hypothetical protein [Chloroflexota bacterium]